MAKAATPVFDRMLDKFTVGGGCWEWTGAKTNYGYGKILTYRKIRLAHRVLYELLVGPVPDGLELDHLCRNASCVNPDHLEPVTHSENIFRVLGKTHCPQGHEYTRDNVYQYAYGRVCKLCQKVRIAARTARRKELN